MSSQYDFPLHTDPVAIAKPFSFFKKTTSAKVNLRRKLSRLVKVAPSFKLPIGIAIERNNCRTVSSRRNQTVRVSGVDFDIFSMPSDSSEWPATPERESFNDSVEDYGTLLHPRFRHQLSTYSLMENYMKNVSCDSLQDMRLKQSLQTQCRQFEQHWNFGPNFDELRRAGSLYETTDSLMDLTEEMNNRIYSITPSVIPSDLLKFGKPFRQSITDELEGFSLDIDTKPSTPFTVKRKPVPLF